MCWILPTSHRTNLVGVVVVLSIPLVVNTVIALPQPIIIASTWNDTNNNDPSGRDTIRIILIVTIYWVGGMVPINTLPCCDTSMLVSMATIVNMCRSEKEEDDDDECTYIRYGFYYHIWWGSIGQYPLSFYQPVGCGYPSR